MMSADGMTQRRLGDLLGISHQRVGRYLREGDIGGVLSIPDDPAFTGALDHWFGEYAALAEEQAKVDHIPFSRQAPVYVERKPLRTGLPGDIIATGNTEYVRRELRDKWLGGMVRTQKFHKVNVRSVISLKDYFDNVAAEEIANGRRGIRKGDLSRMLTRNFIARERERGKIIDASSPFSMYTQSEAATGSPAMVIAGVEYKLQTKHEPATGRPGTKLAYEYVLQQKPANYVKPARKRIPHTRGGRGPK